MDVVYCYIKETFFNEHSDFINMLDAGFSKKQSQRTHLCLCIENDGNRYLIPLRNNLGDAVRKYGRIGHSVPSETRKKAGLDFRYALIVNDDKYLEPQTERKIPRSQYRRIAAEYEAIRAEFTQYINGYKKAAKKRRLQREPLYRLSSLQNFDLFAGV